MTQSREQSAHRRRSGRRQRDAEHTRRDILDAAARAFGRKGFHGTTMEEVASEAGYSVGALYKYFAGKDELYHSLKETIDQQLAAVQERPVPSSLDFWQSFELVLLRYFEVLERNRDWIVVLLAERSAFERKMRFGADEHEDQVLNDAVEFMTDRLAQGMAEGAVRQTADPGALAHMAIGAVHARVEHWMLTGSPADSLVAAAEDVLRFLKHGFGAAGDASQVETAESNTE